MLNTSSNKSLMQQQQQICSNRVQNGSIYGSAPVDAHSKRSGATNKNNINDSSLRMFLEELKSGPEENSVNQQKQSMASIKQ